MKLDIGCGSKPIGDVNLDLFTGLNPHHGFDYDPKEILNFILGDAQDLPFRTSVFSQVICDNVLEHISHPYKALDEMARVSKGSVYIIVPNNPPIREHREHLYTWSLTSLRNLLSKHFTKVEISGYTRMRDVKRSRIFKLVGHPPVLGKPLLRIISRLFALELHAVCMKPIQKDGTTRARENFNPNELKSIPRMSTLDPLAEQ